MRRLLTSLVTFALLFGSTAHAASPRPASQSPIIVTTTADELNSDGDCALREAVVAANTDAPVDACPAGSGADLIFVPAGTYPLTLVGANESAALTGDLDLTANVTIMGAGVNATFIDGNHTDRVLHIGQVRVTLLYLTIQHGAIPGLDVGGGISSDGPLTLDHVTVFSNTIGGAGAGLVSAGGLTVTASTFSSNESYYGGGGLMINGPALIEATTFISNVATHDRGAAIWNNSSVILRNSTVSGNRSQYGGALDSFGPLTLTYSTVTNNTPNGLYLTPTSKFFLENSIVSGNVGLDCVGYKAISLGYNLLGTCPVTLTAGVDITGTALLGPLAANGGPTLTHALLPGSPAIDAADPAACPATDQRGYLRPVNGGSGTARCDIGALEALALTPLQLFLPLARR